MADVEQLIEILNNSINRLTRRVCEIEHSLHKAKPSDQEFRLEIPDSVCRHFKIVSNPAIPGNEVWFVSNGKLVQRLVFESPGVSPAGS